VHGPRLNHWDRLFRLERDCDIVLASCVHESNGSFWTFSIRHRLRPDEAPVIVEEGHPHLAVKRGLEEAERRGWHL
jgi:hypothetical protein